MNTMQTFIMKTLDINPIDLKMFINGIGTFSSISNSPFVNKIFMITRTTVLVIATIVTMNIHVALGQPDMAKEISVSTDFASGGGTVKVISSNPAVISVMPHNEGTAGWSQVWWYFVTEGLMPGEQITIQLDRGEPMSSGISPQIFFSYDQEVWGLTDTGQPDEIDGRQFFIYQHVVRGEKIWFAYDLPYTPEHVEKFLVPAVNRNPHAEFKELTKTRKNRSVPYITIEDKNVTAPQKYGIWLQGRAHAFESGACWVLHELTLWLLSDDPLAIALRKNTKIFIVPIVDVDATVEGRTGKYQKPHDHWMAWDEEPEYWPEVGAIKKMLRQLAEQDMVDLFIDFHGPGGLSHPFFIIPEADKLPFDKQRANRNKFFEVLNAKELTEQAKQYQSMNQIHYSERPWENNVISSSHEWVTMRTNQHSLAFTIEVNMNTPLSTLDGYRSEALTLGKAISNYLVHNQHNK
jgi:hypothetical protein